MTTREELPALLNARGLVGIGAEVGVKSGVFSEHLLRHWHGAKLISIDHWIGEHAHHYDEACERLGRYGPRSEVWRMTSTEAATQVEDGSFDFVYIDAAHDAESVRADLEAWFPKIRAAGILAGHDYTEREGFGVKEAVDAFFGGRGLLVNTTRGIVALEITPSWLVELPAHPGSIDAK